MNDHHWWLAGKSSPTLLQQLSEEQLTYVTSPSLPSAWGLSHISATHARCFASQRLSIILFMTFVWPRYSCQRRRGCSLDFFMLLFTSGLLIGGGVHERLRSLFSFALRVVNSSYWYEARSRDHLREDVGWSTNEYPGCTNCRNRDPMVAWSLTSDGVNGYDHCQTWH